MLNMQKKSGAMRLLILAGLLFVFVGCAMMNIGDGLSRAIMNQDDPETVRDGAPAYMLLTDSLIQDAPNDVGLLMAGAKLYAVYAGVFAESPERAVRLANKARGYGERALCRKNAAACDLEKLPFDQYMAALGKLGKRDVPALYTYTLTWLVRIQVGNADWNAVADLPKVEAALERIVALDATYENGNPQLYLGVINSLRPPALGGQPEKGQQYFEQAIALSNGKALAVKVAYARYYARLVYDQELHDRLLSEVVESNPVAPELTLANVLAQREAVVLLESGTDYF
ncbi:TRAP transporter TatT component family protein [uncultured Pseudodesulfovibrio sp.]|uniref:TRAP transporter TatT component family protein n=1 Tax=uncultured Pseudodesulfovibrio sp. TaxID=2035858 RepID=UPI0029C7CCAD|nr:TRAP transporter TatT component family protein [uncultured Pseudodesulfovibrio sp.]